MWAAPVLSLALAVGDSGTRLASAFFRPGSLFVPKMQRRESLPSRQIFQAEETHYLVSSAGRRPSYQCRSAENEKFVSSKDTQSVFEKSKELWYWVDEESDCDFEVTFQDDDKDKEEQIPRKSKRILKLRFKIHGNPRPLQRHRTSRRHTYNPSIKYQKSFQDAVKKLIFDSHGQSMEIPVFDASKFLAMTIIFRMKRPKSHFVNNIPGPGRLKKKSPSQLCSIRTDVDNLTKFVLDSMNGLLYEDDRQITSIQATKILDNADLCSGAIEVYVRPIEAEDLDKILESSISVIEQDTR